jgi:cyclophilin family peptidyl-prolyl cis-trans isomerase
MSVFHMPVPQGVFRTPTTAASLHYKGTPFHRIVAGQCIQGGDIVAGNGRYNLSAFVGTLLWLPFISVGTCLA